MKFATLVGFGGVCTGLEDASDEPDHACLRGEGTAGVVGFCNPLERRRNDGAPLGVPFIFG